MTLAENLGKVLKLPKIESAMAGCDSIYKLYEICKDYLGEVTLEDFKSALKELMNTPTPLHEKELGSDLAFDIVTTTNKIDIK